MRRLLAAVVVAVVVAGVLGCRYPDPFTHHAEACTLTWVNLIGPDTGSGGSEKVRLLEEGRARVQHFCEFWVTTKYLTLPAHRGSNETWFNCGVPIGTEGEVEYVRWEDGRVLALGVVFEGER